MPALDIPWQQQVRDALAKRKAREVDPFTSVATLVALQQRFRESEEALRSTRSERDRVSEALRVLEEEAVGLRDAAKGLALHNAREKELEAKLAATTGQLQKAMEQTNRLLEAEHEAREAKAYISKLETERAANQSAIGQLSSDLAESNNSNTVLRREYEALQTENKMQRDQFSKTSEENDRLIPLVLEAKKTEAELRNEIVELEQRLAKAGVAPQDSSSSAFAAAPPRDVQFTDPNAITTPQISCIPPSYIAYSVDNAHAAEIHAVAISENGRQLWTGGGEKSIKGWDSNNGASVGRLSTTASTVCLDSRGSYLVAGCVDCTCRVWHLPTMRSICQLTGHTEVVTASTIGVDVNRVFTASRDGTIKSWDLSRGALLHTSVCPSSCNDLATTVDRVMSAHFDGSVRLWDVRTGKDAGMVRDLHEKAVTSIRVAPDGNTAVTLGRDNCLCLVDLRMLQPIHQLSDPRLSVNSNLARVTMSPDGAYCATGSTSGAVLVFSAHDPSKPPKALTKGHQASVLGVAWSPDGKGLASVGTDKRVIFWR